MWKKSNMKSHVYQYLSLKLRSYGTYIQSFSFLVLIAKAKYCNTEKWFKNHRGAPCV